MAYNELRFLCLLLLLKSTLGSSTEMIQESTTFSSTALLSTTLLSTTLLSTAATSTSTITEDTLTTIKSATTEVPAATQATTTKDTTTTERATTEASTTTMPSTTTSTTTGEESATTESTTAAPTTTEASATAPSTTPTPITTVSTTIAPTTEEPITTDPTTALPAPTATTKTTSDTATSSTTTGTEYSTTPTETPSSATTAVYTSTENNTTTEASAATEAFTTASKSVPESTTGTTSTAASSKLPTVETSIAAFTSSPSPASASTLGNNVTTDINTPTDEERQIGDLNRDIDALREERKTLIYVIAGLSCGLLMFIVGIIIYGVRKSREDKNEFFHDVDELNSSSYRRARQNFGSLSHEIGNLFGRVQSMWISRDSTPGNEVPTTFTNAIAEESEENDQKTEPERIELRGVKTAIVDETDNEGVNANVVDEAGEQTVSSEPVNGSVSVRRVIPVSPPMPFGMLPSSASVANDDVTGKEVPPTLTNAIAEEAERDKDKTTADQKTDTMPVQIKEVKTDIVPETVKGTSDDKAVNGNVAGEPVNGHTNVQQADTNTNMRNGNESAIPAPPPLPSVSVANGEDADNVGTNFNATGRIVDDRAMSEIDLSNGKDTPSAEAWMEILDKIGTKE